MDYGLHNASSVPLGKATQIKHTCAMTVEIAIISAPTYWRMAH